MCLPVVEYKKNGEEDWSEVIPIKTQYDHPESEYTRRDIYTALITELEPNSTYIFKLENSAWEKPETELYSYKTLDIENFSILMGGDIGNRQEALNMNENVVRKVNSMY